MMELIWLHEYLYVKWNVCKWRVQIVFSYYELQSGFTSIKYNNWVGYFIVLNNLYQRGVDKRLLVNGYANNTAEEADMLIMSAFY